MASNEVLSEKAKEALKCDSTNWGKRRQSITLDIKAA